jgi:hypothetical protein
VNVKHCMLLFRPSLGVAIGPVAINDVVAIVLAQPVLSWCKGICT